MTQVVRGYKTVLRPTKVQEELFTKACGIARFAYNWGLERNNNVYLWNQLPHPPLKYESAIDQHRILNSRKASDYPWMYEVSKCAPQEALRDLGSAFHNFLTRRDRFRWPSFKNRHGAKQSFTLTGTVRVKDRMIHLPTFGWVKLKERGYLPERSHVLCATVSNRAGRWFVSIGVRKKRVRVPENNNGPVAGVDWGIVHPATVSDGATLERSPRLWRLKWQERHAQKALTRKAKGSKNRLKALLRHQKVWYRITNIRLDRLHKFTTTLARTKSVVVVEDLAACKMAKNHSLAGAIYGGTPYEMRRQLEYKTKWYGSRLIVAPRRYPSTKMCSGCGIKSDISLGEGTYHCAACGLVIDRDLNAAINLANYYHHDTASSAGRACQMQEVTSPQGLVPAGEAGRVSGAV